MKAQSVSFITKTNSLLLFPLLVASCYLTTQESIYMALPTMDLVTESSWNPLVSLLTSWTVWSFAMWEAENCNFSLLMESVSLGLLGVFLRMATLVMLSSPTPDICLFLIVTGTVFLFPISTASETYVFCEVTWYILLLYHAMSYHVNFGYQKDDLRKFYLLPFEVTKEVKLSMFQYKIIHNILCTKSLLFKMKKEDSPRCPFCPVDHTIIHLFTECAQATLFWKEFLDWASRMVNSKLSLSIKEIMFGIINNDSKFCLALNHLVIIGKYFLYVKALNGKFYIFNEFVSLARDKISLEKYLSCTTAREKEFRTKWSVFSSPLNTVGNSVYLTDCASI